MNLCRVLVVDDVRDVADVLADRVGRLGYTSLVAYGVEEALRIFESTPIDLVLSDVKMGRVGGFDLLKEIHDSDPLVPVVLVTGDPTPEKAIEAIRAGASEYLPKPVNAQRLEQILRRLIIPHARRVAGLGPLDEPAEPAHGRIIGRSPGMIDIFTTVARVADEDTPVLILGENGAGKEVVAQALHERSRRVDRPFVAVNVASISPNLAESEFFGHERGAFTDARSRRAGVFEQAEGGTLFLDEIADLEVGLQAKILRAIQERRIKRVGGGEEIPTSARLVTATNRDLRGLVHAGRFRQDLYFRINVVTLRLPPLRERPEDIVELASYFLARAAQRSGRRRPDLTPEALMALRAHAWPGNVRELENVMQRALQSSGSGQVTPEMLALGESAEPQRQVPDAPARSIFSVPGTPPLQEVLRDYVDHVLSATDGNVTRAAEVLGVSRRTLQRWRSGNPPDAEIASS